MKNHIEWIGSIENSKISLNQDIQWDILQVLRNTLANMRNQIVEESKRMIWYPSIKYTGPENGIDENWFDCSGFITYILKKFGLSKENIRHANEYFDSYWVSVHRELIQPWDLIFLSRDWLAPKHIWIVISPEEYIHSPGKDNMIVEIQKIKDEPIKKNTPWKMYAINPIWFKRIILESSENKFDFNWTDRKRRTKIV